MGRVPDAARTASARPTPPPHAAPHTAPPPSRYTQVMYNVDAWSAQLETRIANGSLLLNRPTNLGRPGGSQEEAFARALARLEADLKYHREIFVEPTSKVILASLTHRPHHLLPASRLPHILPSASHR